MQVSHDTHLGQITAKELNNKLKPKYLKLARFK